jgi:hypothetical protein
METVSGLPTWATETYGENYSFHEITSAKCNATVPGTVYTNKCPNGPCIEGFPYEATSTDNVVCKNFVAGTTVNRKHICQILNAIQAAHYFPWRPYGEGTYEDGEQVSAIMLPQWGTRANICEFADPVNNVCTRGQSADDVVGGIGTFGSGGEIVEEKIEPKQGICFFPPFRYDESQYDWTELPETDPNVGSTYGKPYYTKEYVPPNEEDLTIIEIPYAGDLNYNYQNQIKQYYASSVKITFEKIHVNGYVKISTNCASAIYSGYDTDYTPKTNLETIELPISTTNIDQITIEIYSASKSTTVNDIRIVFDGVKIKNVYLYQPTALFSPLTVDPVSYSATQPSETTPYFSTNYNDGSSVPFLYGTPFSTNDNLKDKLICSSGRRPGGGGGPFFFPNYPLQNLSLKDNKATSNNIVAIQTGLLNIKGLFVANWHTMMLEENFGISTLPYYIARDPLNMRDVVFYRQFDNVFLNGSEFIGEDESGEVVKNSMDFPEEALTTTFIRQDGEEEEIENVKISWLPIYGIRFNAGPLYWTEEDYEDNSTSNTTTTEYPTIYGPPGEQIITQTVTDTFTSDSTREITTISPGDGQPHTETITTSETYSSTRDITKTVTIPPEMIIPGYSESTTYTVEDYLTNNYYTVTSNAHHNVGSDNSDTDDMTIGGGPRLFLGHTVPNIFSSYATTPNPFGFINYSPCWAISDLTIPQTKQLVYYSEKTDLGGNKDKEHIYFHGPDFNNWDIHSYKIPNGVMARAIIKNPRTFSIQKLYLKINDTAKIQLGFPAEIEISDFTYNKYTGLINMPLIDKENYYLDGNNGEFKRTQADIGTTDYDLYVRYKINACPHGQCTENYYQEKYSWGHFYFSSHPYGHTNQVYNYGLDSLIYEYPQYIQNVLSNDWAANISSSAKTYQHKIEFNNVTSVDVLNTNVNIPFEPLVWIGDDFTMYSRRLDAYGRMQKHNNSDIYKMIMWLRRYIENSMFNIPNIAMTYGTKYSSSYQEWEYDGTVMFSTSHMSKARSGDSITGFGFDRWIGPYAPQYIFGGTDLTRTAIYSGIGGIQGTYHTVGVLFSFSKTAGATGEYITGGTFVIPPSAFILYSKYNGDLTWTFKILRLHYPYEAGSGDFSYGGSDWHSYATLTISHKDLYKIRTLSGAGITAEVVCAYVVGNVPGSTTKESDCTVVGNGLISKGGAVSSTVPHPTYGWETFHLPLRRYAAFLNSSNVVYEYLREKTNVDIDIFDFNQQFKLRCLYAYNKDGKTYCRKSLFSPYGFSNREIMNEQCPCPNIMSEKNCYLLRETLGGTISVEVATPTGPYVYTGGDKTLNIIMRTHSPGDDTRTQITALKVNVAAEKMELYIEREQGDGLKLYRTYDNINTGGVEKILRIVSYYPYQIRIKLYNITYFEYRTNNVVTFKLKTTTKTVYNEETDFDIAHSYFDDTKRNQNLKMEYYCMPLIGELISDLQEFAKKITQGYRQMWSKVEYKSDWKRIGWPINPTSETDYTESSDSHLVSVYYTNRNRGGERDGQITYAVFPYEKKDDKPFPDMRDDTDGNQKDYIWPDI